MTCFSVTVIWLDILLIFLDKIAVNELIMISFGRVRSMYIHEYIVNLTL